MTNITIYLLINLSQRLVGMSLYYDIAGNNLQIDSSTTDLIEMKLFTQNGTYYTSLTISNGYANKSCANSSLYYSEYDLSKFDKVPTGKYPFSPEVSRI